VLSHFLSFAELLLVVLSLGLILNILHGYDVLHFHDILCLLLL